MPAPSSNMIICLRAVSVAVHIIIPFEGLAESIPVRDVHCSEGPDRNSCSGRSGTGSGGIWRVPVPVIFVILL